MVNNYFVQDDNCCVSWRNKQCAEWDARKGGSFISTWRGIWRVKEWKEKV